MKDVNGNELQVGDFVVYTGKTLGITKFTAGTAINNTPSVSLLKTLGFELIGTENVSFYKDAQGHDIVFEGGIFKFDTVC